MKEHKPRFEFGNITLTCYLHKYQIFVILYIAYYMRS